MIYITIKFSRSHSHIGIKIHKAMNSIVGDIVNLIKSIILKVIHMPITYQGSIWLKVH